MRIVTWSASRTDRFGLTWHPAIAAGVLANRDRIDLVEVIPEGRFLESRTGRRALARLARTMPVSIHAVSLGLASASPVDSRRLDRLGRLIGEVEPESWSEHLAFVRSGGIELGHLAAPPRTELIVEKVAANVELARRCTGSYPSLENVATPIDPPGSDLSEELWLQRVFEGSPAGFLLDLHNLYTNATNFGFDPAAALASLPLDRIRAVHIAGGIETPGQHGETRRVDDHLHDVPEAVYELLSVAGERIQHPLDVVLERDGAFPPMPHLLAQLDRARDALARGRARASVRAGVRDAATTADFHNRRASSDGCRPQTQPGSTLDAALIERLLARLYTDAAFRARFLAAPAAELTRAGVPPELAHRFEHPDATGLELAAATFAHKRQALPADGRWPAWLERLRSTAGAGGR
jgi:uncharacterized protein (UPF0276 family)